MPQLSLIAMSNFKAIQDENCQLGSEEGESGTYDWKLAQMLLNKKKKENKTPKVYITWTFR